MWLLQSPLLVSGRKVIFQSKMPLNSSKQQTAKAQSRGVASESKADFTGFFLGIDQNDWLTLLYATTNSNLSQLKL